MTIPARAVGSSHVALSIQCRCSPSAIGSTSVDWGKCADDRRNAASRFGPVLKVSEEGVITSFDHGKIWEI